MFLVVSSINLCETQGGLDISPEGYGHMTQMLLGLAGGRVIMVLEVKSYYLPIKIVSVKILG